MTLCQLYGLNQYGRVGDYVGLAVGTTSWNVGDEGCMWFNVPDEEHPFKAMNLFRLKDDRLEHIGQSHVLHGVYALGSHQCDGPPCTYEPGHGPGDWLGTGCTNTHSPGLSALQSDMGPRYEVNPWTGEWCYDCCHFIYPGSHSEITHRLAVHDDDLDPAQNAGAAYYVEGYYVMLDDVDVMNSAAWKPVTVSGSPGDEWEFDTSEAGDYPNIGFGIDAWPGAEETLLAQEIPVVEFESPDGRCLLAAKATELEGGMYHYEYALYNVDMDRQVGSFSIPVSPGAAIANVGFHAVEHHDESTNTTDPDGVPIDNAPWTVEVTDSAITWSTTTNPLRWGTMYNFRFDADAPPTDVAVTLGMFRPGTPETVVGETLGPVCVGSPDCNGDESVDAADLAILLGSWGPCPCCVADQDGDGEVGAFDLATLLSAWGPFP